MGKNLTKVTSVKSQPNRLTDRNSAVSQPNKLTDDKNTNKEFKISICEQLDNGYSFKNLTKESLKNLHTFIDETVGKNLTISKTEKLYLRTKGEVKQTIAGREVIHFGKDMKAFRIFGYYNNDGYFNITRIDFKHNTNKSS
ncbi:MAG6450 family protein [Streptococcus pneumoniae]